MILSDEEAKAAQEVAKTASNAIDLVRGAGSVLVDSTVASIPADALGLVFGGDWLHEVRIPNLRRMQGKTAPILDGIDKDRLSAPSPSVVLPLLTAAADETREELQDLWAALLANAMLDGGRKVRRDYFEAVRHMEPADAVLLRVILEVQPPAAEKAALIISRARESGLSDNEWQVSLGNLVHLRCCREAPIVLTPFGSGLLDACTVN